MPATATLSYAAEQVRRYDRDRFVTCLFAPAARREALFTLYAFNLEVAKVPELVREPMMGRIRIQWWRDIVDAAGQGSPPDHPVAGPFAELLATQCLDRQEIGRLLDAREADVEPMPPVDVPALESYGDATAGSLCRLALAVLDAEGEAAVRAAGHIGVAWALTGTLRAVRFQAGLGRVRLPTDLLAAHGVAPESVAAGTSAPGLSEVARQIAERAREHMRSARAERRSIDRRALPALLPGLLAERYLAALHRHRYDPLAPGWADTRPRPLLLAAAAALGRY